MASVHLQYISGSGQVIGFLGYPMKIGTHSSSFFQWKVTNLNRFILSIASVRCRFLYLVIAACHVKDADLGFGGASLPSLPVCWAISDAPRSLTLIDDTEHLMTFVRLVCFMIPPPLQYSAWSFGKAIPPTISFMCLEITLRKVLSSFVGLLQYLSVIESRVCFQSSGFWLPLQAYPVAYLCRQWDAFQCSRPERPAADRFPKYFSYHSLPLSCNNSARWPLCNINCVSLLAAK